VDKVYDPHARPDTDGIEPMKFRNNFASVRVSLRTFWCKGVVVAWAGLMLGAGRGGAAVINAGSASESDIEAAISKARNGDTVLVPPGVSRWTSTLRLTKGITLRGSGTNSTTIIDEIPRTGSYAAFINAILTPKQSFRLTGFTFQHGETSKFGDNGFVRIGGQCPSVRIDHCFFDQLYQGESIKVFGQLFGVIDHCFFLVRDKTQCILVWHDGWGGGNNAYGDGSWADDSYFGSEKFMFIEDNVFDNSLNKRDNGIIDCYAGGRMVVRHNNFINCRPNTHGTESSHRVRGFRAAEIYDNTESLNFRTSGGQFRGGTGLEFSNTLTGLFNGERVLTVYREFSHFPPWGEANGTNPWDVNDPHGVYLTGKHTGTNGSPTLVVANAGWTPDQWVGYSVINSAITSPKQQFGSLIKSNTSDTMTVWLDDGFRLPLTFNTGDTFAIYRVITALDQCGRGKGDLLSGGDGTTPPSPKRWPNEALDPIYAWGNTLNGSPANIISRYPTVQEGRDFFNNTPKPGYKPYTYPHPLVAADSANN
jgi:hypothetical protein